MELKKLPEETFSQYLWRMGTAKDAGLISLNWTELADVMNKNLFTDESDYMGESAFRKRYSYAKEMYDDVFSKTLEDEELESLKREVMRERIKLRDERSAWNKQNYSAARVEQDMDYLGNKLQEIGKLEFEKVNSPVVDSDNDLLILLSDLHIGETFSNMWGEYNADIAKSRLEKLLTSVKTIQQTHNSSRCYIVLSGDCISGNIHRTIQVANRENVIDQIKIATELVANFCYELCPHFEKVFFTDVVGNHSRMDVKDDAVHDERLDSIVSWGVEMSLSHIENFVVMSGKLDSGIADTTIRGNRYISVHGDYDAYSPNGVSKLCMMLGFIPYAITYGHLHTCAVEEYNGVKMIRGGSLAGTGDQYTLEKRMTGNPSQMVCVCNSAGVMCYYPVMV